MHNATGKPNFGPIGTSRGKLATFDRTTFRTSRALDFLSEKQLVAQTGHAASEWPAVIVKELVDNGLDACESADIAPEITIVADHSGISVSDNGPGLPESTITGALDFTIKVSSNEAYVSPTRGAQGNALKTLLAMPYVVDPDNGHIAITTAGERWIISCRLNPISQRIEFDVGKSKLNPISKTSKSYKSGTTVRVAWEAISGQGGPFWPFGPRRNIGYFREQMESLARGFSLFNPHLTLALDWFSDRKAWKATDHAWRKWKPNQQTSAHWYDQAALERLIGAYITHDADAGTDRTAAAFVAEFDGLTGNKKRTAVLDKAGIKRAHLSDLATDRGMRSDVIAGLLAAMKGATVPVHPRRLGEIGKAHFTKRLLEFGCDPKSIGIPRAEKRIENGVAFVLETAFGYLGGEKRRQIYAGANWSASLKNPFRSFGTTGEGLEAVLTEQRSGRFEPIIFAIHLAKPRVEYQDRGKSSITVENDDDD